MSDAWNVPVMPDNSALQSLVELKRRLTELKLEALRRGYGIEPEPENAIDDVDVIAADAVRSMRRHDGDDTRRDPEQDCGTRTSHGRLPTSSRA